MSIEQIEQMHNEAMILADDADLFKRRGQMIEARDLYARAFTMERQAAMDAISSGVESLSTSVLIKSSAFIAYDAGLIRESEQMVGLALSRDLPEEIAEEMRDLLENLHFSRHLRLNGITLSDNEVQIVVAGNGVAHGMAREDDVNDRIATFKQMVVRGAERSRGKKFRTNGQPSREIRDICTSYLSLPRAASFAVTMRLGETTEKTLDSFQGGANALIEDIATNLSLVNKQDIPALKERIKDQAYLENFVNLAKEFAPDGDRVNLVGLTFNKNGKVIPVELTTPKIGYREVVSTIVAESVESGTSQEKMTKEQLVGMLYAANAQSDSVKLQVDGRGSINIKVPEGLTEIVRKYFDTDVTVLVSHDKQKKSFRLLSVDVKDDNPQLF